MIEEQKDILFKIDRLLAQVEKNRQIADDFEEAEDYEEAAHFHEMADEGERQIRLLRDEFDKLGGTQL